MTRAFLCTLLTSSLAGCFCSSEVGGTGGGGGGGGGTGGGSGGGTAGGAADGGTNSLTCRPCLTKAECTPGGECVQYSGDSFCGNRCTGAGGCNPTEDCVLASDFSGRQVQVCLPRSGSCAVDGGAADAGVDGGICGPLIPPTFASCCHSCTPGVSNCQSNGCYGGWWCESSNAPSCFCRPPPVTCAPDDAGFFDAGAFDAGPPGDGGFVGPNGGTVNRLFFAVVGDTRPANPDETSTYPTAVITKIYADLAAMKTQPQFVITTGDYQFSNPYGFEAAIQLGYYTRARDQYLGPVFAAMGNHECSGATASNCVGAFTGRNNYDAFMAGLVTPLGKSTPYYSVPVQTSAGSASFILVACNA